MSKNLKLTSATCFATCAARRLAGRLVSPFLFRPRLVAIFDALNLAICTLYFDRARKHQATFFSELCPGRLAGMLTPNNRQFVRDTGFKTTKRLDRWRCF